MAPPEHPPVEGPELSEEPSSPSEEVKAPSFISKLFPPPPTLIKETLGRYKTTESIEEEVFPENGDSSPLEDDGEKPHHRSDEQSDDENPKFEE